MVTKSTTTVSVQFQQQGNGCHSNSIWSQSRHGLHLQLNHRHIARSLDSVAMVTVVMTATSSDSITSIFIRCTLQSSFHASHKQLREYQVKSSHYRTKNRTRHNKGATCGLVQKCVVVQNAVTHRAPDRHVIWETRATLISCFTTVWRSRISENKSAIWFTRFPSLCT